MKTTAVIVARFQTPYLHDGHKEMIDTILKKHRKVVIVLGVTVVRVSKRNPYDFHTRAKMIKATYPDVVALPLPDHIDDRAWSSNLNHLLTSTFPGEAFQLYGARDSFIPYYSGGLPVEELPEKPNYSGTATRQEHSDEVLGSVDFRLGINYCCQNKYPGAYPTVDIALIKEDMILMGKREGSDYWRLPGGFVSPEDANFEDAALRELIEECGKMEVRDIQYVGSFKVDDWRYRQEEDKIITTLFMMKWVSGVPAAGDDLKYVKWLSVHEVVDWVVEGGKNIAPEHVALIKALWVELPW